MDSEVERDAEDAEDAEHAGLLPFYAILDVECVLNAADDPLSNLTADDLQMLTSDGGRHAAVPGLSRQLLDSDEMQRLQSLQERDF